MWNIIIIIIIWLKLLFQNSEILDSKFVIFEIRHFFINKKKNNLAILEEESQQLVFDWL